MIYKKEDKKVICLLENELKRQQEELQLIPSENLTSKQVREAMGSIFSHKYSEGQIGRRYYEGNEITDKVEHLCKTRALKLFRLNKNDWHINVQALSGSIANLAVYNAMLNPGDKIMSLSLTHGGHLSHGWIYKGKRVTLASKIYKVCYYYLNQITGKIDYNKAEEIAIREKPKLIISGGTAVPREINHKKLSRIAKIVGAYYLADISHEAGLVAANVNKSPFPYADFVTMTTHKTLRGPRGALIFARKKFANQIDRSVFPGIQGGPFMNNILGIAVALKEAQGKNFIKYAIQVINNAKLLAKELTKFNFKLISGGTDKHLLIIDLRNKGINGAQASRALKSAGITCNKNTIPDEKGTPNTPSGIRLGTPFETSRGLKEKEMKIIAKWINEVIEISKKYSKFSPKEFEKSLKDNPRIKEIKNDVKKLCKKYISSFI